MLFRKITLIQGSSNSVSLSKLSNVPYVARKLHQYFLELKLFEVCSNSIFGFRCAHSITPTQDPVKKKLSLI